MIRAQIRGVEETLGVLPHRNVGAQAYRACSNLQQILAQVNFQLIERAAQGCKCARLIGFWPEECRKSHTSMRARYGDEIDQQGQLFLQAQ